MRTDNTQVAVSTACEDSYNTPKTLAANFEDLATTDPFFYLPKVEKLTDANRIGRNAPSHLCNNYWSHSEVAIKDDLHTGAVARLVRRGLGGAVTDTAVDAFIGIYDHEFAILPPQVGDILPSFDIISKLGLADFLLAGVMTDKLKFMQKSNQRVQFEGNLVGSGKFVQPSGVAMPARADVPCMDGFRVEVKYTDADGATVVNLTTLGTLLEWMVEHDNKIRRNKRRSGDPLQTVDGATAAHTKAQPRGKYETKGQIVLDFNDLTYWLKSVKNQVLSNLSFLIPGTIINGIYRHEFEIIIPKFGFEGVDTGDDEGDATTPINIICLEDPVTKGTMKCRVRNTTATLV